MAENERPDIIYTKVDEAPELASASLLPIIRAFTRPAGIKIGTKDISLAGRILANFPQYLKDDQKQPDDLAELGKLVTQPEANVIKLPNISASISQINACVKELQDQGYAIPSYPEAPATTKKRPSRRPSTRSRAAAVNPVLREGNSDRRAPKAVKEYARKHPHSMGAWSSSSKTHVATMGENDFCSNEKSVTVAGGSAGNARIEFVANDGAVTVLKDAVALDDRRRHRRDDDERQGAARLPGSRDRRRQTPRRAVFRASEVNDDEGLRPDHLRPLRQRLSQGRLRQACAKRSRNSASIPTTVSATCCQGRDPSRCQKATRSKPT